MANQIRDIYKYHFKVGNLIVHRGITQDLISRESQHQSSGSYNTFIGERYYWKDGHIVQIGNITTREAALAWEREQHRLHGGT